MSSKLYIKFTPPDQIILPYEPETTAYMNNTDVNIPNDGTVYFSATAYQITGAELWTALDAFLVSVKTSLGLTLKQNNLSTKFKFLYPRIGGTATAHAVDLVSGISTGVFGGGLTHDGSGILPNGTNGYFNTTIGYTPSNFGQNDQLFGYVSKTDATGVYADFGVAGYGYQDVFIDSRRSGNTFSSRLADGTTNTNSNSNSIGHFSINRQSSVYYKQYIDGVLLGTVTQSSTTNNALNGEIHEFAAIQNGSIVAYSPRKQTIFYAGNSVTDLQMTDIHNAINTLETTLNR